MSHSISSGSEVTDRPVSSLLSAIHTAVSTSKLTKPAATTPSLFTACPKPAQIASERAFGVQMGVDDGGGGGIDSPDGVASGRIVSVIFHCSINSTRWRAIMEKVDAASLA